MKEFSKTDLFLYPVFLHETGKENNQKSIEYFRDYWLLQRNIGGMKSLGLDKIIESEQGS